MQGRCCCFSKVTIKPTQPTLPQYTTTYSQSLLLEPFLYAKSNTASFKTTNNLPSQIAKKRMIQRSHIQAVNSILNNLKTPQTTKRTKIAMITTRSKESPIISRERMEREVKQAVTLNP
jgi:hypothetical protein